MKEENFWTVIAMLILFLIFTQVLTELDVRRLERRIDQRCGGGQR
jgi:hypothetical protein